MGAPKASTLAVAALAIIVAGALARQWMTIAALRAERDIAQADRTHMSALAAENRRLQEKMAKVDISALQRENDTLVRRRAAVAAVPAYTPAAETSAVPSPAGFRSSASWKNLGLVTPATAAETMLFAAAHGDLDLLAHALTLEPAARAKVEAVWSTLPEASRTQYGTPEHLVALFVAHNALRVASMQAIEETAPAPDVTLRFRLKTDQGQEKAASFVFRASPAGWQFVVPTNLVDNLVAMLTRGIPPS